MREIKWTLVFISIIRASPPKIQWDISHCVDEIISPGVGDEQHSKVIVSRYYPSPMGKNWQCEYKIQNPDTKMKIMIEWKYFDLADCHLQNVTVVDWKTKNAVGPYCGTDTPPLYLSDSNQLRVFVKSGDLPDGDTHVGFMMKVTRAPEGFEAEFEQMKYQAELAKNPQPQFPFPAAGGRLGPLPGGFGQTGPSRPGMMGRPGLAGRSGMGPGGLRGRAPPGRRPMGGPAAGMGQGPGRPGQRRPMMRQTSSSPQQFGDGPPHLSASYQNNFQKDIDATQYSQAAIKAMQNYKKRQSIDQIDSPMPSVPMRQPPMRQAIPPMAPQLPPQAPAMDPQMQELMQMMELLAQQEQQQAAGPAGMQIINGIPVMPDPTQAPPPIEHSYPAKVEPVDPLRDVHPIKPLQGVPVKTTVPKTFKDRHEQSERPDFSRIPSGAGAAQNKPSMNKFYVPTPAKKKDSKKPFEWTMEKIVALVCTAVVFVAAVIIGVTCTLRSKEKMKTRKYKEKERIDAARKYERTTLERKLKRAKDSDSDSDVDTKKLEKRLKKYKAKLDKA